MSKPEYPEAEKWAKVHEAAREILAFEDWLQYTYPDGRPFNKTTDDLVYEYFEIDAKKLEEERRAMIESMRNV